MDEPRTQHVERDRALWQRWRRGDRAAGSRLFELYEAALFGLIRRLGVHDPTDAEDLYSELLLGMTEYKDRQELHSSFFGLARRMAVSLVARLARHQRRNHPVEDVDQIAAVIPGGGCDTVSFQESLRLCLGGLRKPLELDLFRQRFLHGQDNRSLAEHFDKTPNHVAVIVHGAVIKMRECLAAAGFSV